MADISSELQFRITQTGAKELSQSLVDVDGKMQGLGKTTSNLTQFIREQRTENRQQNFLFRESRDVIGSLTFATIALTSATGGSSKEMQKFNQVLTTGFTAFQAANFAMAALGVASGGVSVAIQAVVGIGAALLAFLGATKEKAEEAKKALGFFDDLNERLNKSRVAQNKAFGEPLEMIERITFLQEQQKKIPSLFNFYQKEVVILNAELERMHVLLKASPGFTERENSLITGGSLDRGLLSGKKGPGFKGGKQKLGGVLVDEDVVGKELSKIKLDFADMVGAAIISMGALEQVSSGLARGIHDVFRGATEGIGGAFKSMADGIIEQLGRIAEELAASAIISLLGSFFGLGSFAGLFGGLTGLIHGKGRISPGSTSSGGSGTTINVNQNFSAFDGRGLKQTFNKPEVRNAITSALNDAARKGKV